MKRRVFLFIVVLFIFMTREARSDIVYLKNGRHIEGLIKKESEDNVVLDVGFGTIKFRHIEIEKIHYSDKKETGKIEKDWQAQKKLQKKRQLEREKELEETRRRKEFEPKEVGYLNEKEHIVVNTLLNKKVKASFLLDTGATVVLLSNRIAKRLKISLRGSNKDKVKVQTADGRMIDAKFIILDSVSVEGIEVKDVEAVVLLEESTMNVGDGLLGMSFLNRFNFQIDTVNKKLILKKRKQ